VNSPIRKVAAALCVLFAAVFVNLNVVQVVQGSHYRNDPANRRVLLDEYAHPRGQIVVQGTAIAKSKKTSNDELKYLRQYPNGPMYAAVTGYYSYVYGSSGIEGAENSLLSGDDPKLFTTQLAGLLTGRDPSGGSVDLTLNRAAQTAAYQAMKNNNGGFKRGAVVALDPTTGAILALVSTPSFDPALLSSHNSDAIVKAWDTYCNPDTAGNCRNPDDPLLNRALNQVYAPGSVFKVIVSAEALKEGVTPDKAVFAPNSYWPGDPQKTTACPASTASPCVSNFDRETCDPEKGFNGKTAPLIYAFAKSCNTAFSALLVDQLNVDKFIQTAHDFGIDEPYAGSQPDLCNPPAFKTPLPACRSTLGSADDISVDSQLARIAFGQQDVRITPLQAAMISAAVANNGSLMKPYLVAKEEGPTFSVISQTKPEQLSQAVDPEVAAELQEMMKAVVNSREGTGGSARIPDSEVPGVTVGGKTGTADTGIVKNGKQTAPHAWFSGFALKDGKPKIAVAVIIENGGVNGNETTGGLAAAPVAKAVMEAYLKSTN
jgi:peptidoglycan glycosyltransferase